MEKEFIMKNSDDINLHPEDSSGLGIKVYMEPDIKIHMDSPFKLVSNPIEFTDYSIEFKTSEIEITCDSTVSLS